MEGDKKYYFKTTTSQKKAEKIIMDHLLLLELLINNGPSLSNRQLLKILARCHQIVKGKNNKALNLNLKDL